MMNKLQSFSLLGLAVFSALTFSQCNEPMAEDSATSIQETENETAHIVKHSSKIVWEALNPARGKSSPLAGTLWGDRKGDVATGFVAKFVDGFSSPPHIHNVTYRAVVIKGTIHNGDSANVPMWMGPGSFWTQPVGQAHITAAKGEENMAYVEIDKGPYLVKPTNEAFESAEQPVNVDASNIVWLNQEEAEWIETSSQAQLSYLWDDGNNKGLFFKLPTNFQGELLTSGTEFHAVVIQGKLDHGANSENLNNLDVCSYFSASDPSTHFLSNKGSEEVIVYVRTNGSMKLR